MKHQALILKIQKLGTEVIALAGILSPHDDIELKTINNTRAHQLNIHIEVANWSQIEK